MKSTAKNQSGFAIIELLAVVVVVAVTSVVGMRLMQNKSTTKTATAPTTSTTAMPVKIQSKDDLTLSANSLDSTPIVTSLDPAQLDSSLNSLL